MNNPPGVIETNAENHSSPAKDFFCQGCEQASGGALHPYLFIGILRSIYRNGMMCFTGMEHRTRTLAPSASDAPLFLYFWIVKALRISV